MSVKALEVEKVDKEMAQASKNSSSESTQIENPEQEQNVNSTNETLLAEEEEQPEQQSDPWTPSRLTFGKKFMQQLFKSQETQAKRQSKKRSNTADELEILPVLLNIT